MSFRMSFREAFVALIASAAILPFAACGSRSSNLPITVTFTPGFTPPPTMTASSTAGIAATITNGPQNAVVNWTCTPVGQCGRFIPTSTASAIPTSYSTPGGVPQGGSVTITATTATTPSASVSATITISGCSGDTCD